MEITPVAAPCQVDVATTSRRTIENCTAETSCKIGSMTPLLAVVLAGSVTIGSHTSTQAGSIVGCMSDITRKPVPGGTVTAKADGLERTTMADKSGCYALRDLPAGWYRVTARLLGFDNVTRDRLAVVSATPTRLDFTMRVSPICECVRVAGTLAEHWKHADAVLHIRLSDSETTGSTPQGYYRHAATVLTALKEPPGRPEPLFVIQNQRSGVPGPVRCWTRAGGIPRVVRG